MKLKINSKIFENFDNPRLAVTVVTGADNSGKLDLSKDFSALVSELEIKHGGGIVSEIPKIAAWREAYRTFGSKPKDYPSSIESLLKRVLKGGNFWGISPLVDIYNYVSLKHLLPAGGEDTDKMSGDLELTLASADEGPVVVLGKDTEEPPKEGEVIYKDSEGTICRRWNWREVARTVITENTTNCILVFEALDPVSDEELLEAQKELGELIQEHCSAEVEHHFLNKDTPSVTING